MGVVFLKMGVVSFFENGSSCCFFENGSWFFENGSSFFENAFVFRKWEFVFLEMGVCFFENGSLFFEDVSLFFENVSFDSLLPVLLHVPFLLVLQNGGFRGIVLQGGKPSLLYFKRTGKRQLNELLLPSRWPISSFKS